MTIAISHGLGRKIDDLPPMDKPAARRWSLITVSTICFNFVLPKFSFAAFIMRLVRNSKTSGQLKALQSWPWVSCYLSLFYITVVAIWEWAQCQPLSYQWNLIPDTGYCYPARINVGLAVSSSILSATVDLVLVLYPLFHIIPLQMPTRKKLLAGSPLLGGLAASTVSIVKIVHLFSGLAEIGRDPTCKFGPASAQTLLTNPRLTRGYVRHLQARQR
ncbi:hypothetical protein Tdes44962_MAKER03039 [Teratosphaeria destructans]|uniref:Rhodopsin domain-containing protein n=1 Tax=Teratosphaeria destructans TaxID=418781 RepID=A0A9W7W1U5_9PEZI|nr:hypothetical protein Tdes44962_MAKER03039 [Teratosphaeria destructans]